ncbi:MAG: AAA family ATPase [Methylococcus sp.]|nr:AAA family ATPase [Methylococcus sp.]
MTESGTPDPLLTGLMRPEAYPHPVSSIQLIETHISWVFLTGTYAYKIKKPVNFGFLDFSTLERRQRFCLEEVRLNRRLAPEVYLDTVAITGSPRAPRIEGDGPEFEYAVKMRQFPADALLADLAASQRLTTANIDALAQLLAEFHRSISRNTVLDSYGSVTDIRSATLQNFAQIQAALATEHRSSLDQLAELAQRDHARLDTVFRNRKKDGFVRECHGDLHLANIALIDGKPVPFDAIEFNPALRWIDVISELAFLAMDLEARGLPQLAARLVNGYLSITGDYAGMVLWNYYRRYRAMVRAKIAALTWESSAGTAAKNALLGDFKRYVDYASSLEADQPPRLVLMHGVSGSGKTHIAQRLAEEMNAVMIRSDVERKRIAARDYIAPARLYLPELTRTTYTRLNELAEPILKAGHSVILDATFLEREFRDAAKWMADQTGALFTIVSADAPPEVLRERILARRKTGLDPSDADLDVLEMQLRSRKPLGEDEQAFVVEYGPDSAPPGLADIIRAIR